MDIKRVILFAAFALVGFSLWNNWQLEHPVADNLVASNQSQSLPAIPNEDDSSHAAESPTLVSDVKEANSSMIIAQVKTDVYDLSIDALGNIVDAKLLNYPVSTEQKDRPITLLQKNNLESYVANSHLFEAGDNGIKDLKVIYQSTRPSYVLNGSENELVVSLRGKVDDLSIEKQYVFNKNSYLIDVRYQITNESGASWKGYMDTELVRTSPKEDKSSMFHVGSFTGASYSNPGHSRYKKLSFSDMNKNKLNVLVEGGWVAMQQHYFLTAWVPNQDSKHQFYTRAQDNAYEIGAVSQAIHVAPNTKQTISSRLYIGPEITSILKSIAPGLDQTVDYGWLWFLSSVLFSLMKSIYTLVGNWGWSIVLVTLLIKLAFYRLSATSYKSMANMRKLQPKLQALRERYGDDKAKISQATMELYRQEKVNPLGGCLPILIQIPVFIALYWVLLESVELRQAPFILWIKDLAMADPYHVLPVIMGATMLIQQKLNPAPPDPTQAKVMMFLPILFTGLFWNFPAGLVLYWIVNNTLSILQQWYITKKFGGTDAPTAKSKLVVAK